MCKLYTDGKPWLGKDGKEMEFTTQWDANIYADCVDGTHYLMIGIGIEKWGLFKKLDREPTYTICS